MLKRRFGKTEMNLSVLSFGAMRIPPEGPETYEASMERAFPTLRRALDEGINHIETARGYGKSEEQIGAALKQGIIKREEFYLTTKIWPTETAEEFRKLLDDSMARMNVSYVDNLDIHGINTAEILQQALKPDGALTAIRAAIDEKIVGHVGFSTHGPLEVIEETIRTGEFESVNLHYYYINQRNEPAVALANSMDMGVYIISPTDKGGQLFNPPARLSQLCAPWTPIEMNQRWLLCQPAVHTLSLGAAKPEELDAHLAMANREQGPLAPDEQAIIDRLDSTMKDALGPELCRFCHDCLPCPEDVNIPEILRLRNLVKAYDMTEFGKFRYKMFRHRDPKSGDPVGGSGHWFPGSDADFCTDCSDCLPRCPANLRIPELLRETHGVLSGEVGKRLWE